MNSPVFPSLDDIYCINMSNINFQEVVKMKFVDTKKAVQITVVEIAFYSMFSVDH